jgi:hypothetical protein
MITPPFVPQIDNVEDTHYFDEEEPISDWSESCSSDNSDSETEVPLEANTLVAAVDAMNLSLFAPPIPAPHAAAMHNAHPSTAIRRSPQKLTAMHAQLAAFPRHARGVLAQFVASPYDSTRLKRMDREIDALVGTNSGAISVSAQQPPSTPSSASAAAITMPYQDINVMLGDQMKAFIRTFGRRERKRPRDRLLRDHRTKATVLEVRKKTAFLGYTFRRSTDADKTSTTDISIFDGAEKMVVSKLRDNGMERIPEAGELEGEEVGEGSKGVDGGTGIRPDDAVQIAAYRALYQGPMRISM